MTEDHTIDNLPTASQPYAKAMRKKMGRLLEIHRRMAASPAVISAYAGIGGAIAEHGTLDARTRETIALAVASENGCDYCQAAHTLSARAAGLSDDQILEVRAGDVRFDAKLAAIATIARTAAANTGSVPDEMREEALSAGWTAEELEELFAHVAVNLFTNYFNHSADTELDVPAAPPMPQDRA